MGNIDNFFNMIHMKLFGHDMSKDMAKFVKNLSWVFICTFIAKFFIFVIQIVGGRVLREEIYGNYSLIVTIASVLMMPIILFSCSVALIKYVSSAKSEKEKKDLISSTRTSFIFGMIVVMSIYLLVAYLFGDVIVGFFNISNDILLLSLVGVVVWSIYSYSESVLRSLNRQKVLGIATIISHLVTLVLFFVLLLYYRNVLLMFIPVFVGYAVYFVISLFNTRKYLVGKFNSGLMKELFKYNKFIFLVSVTYAIMANIDKIMLNYYIGPASVGIYHAYYTASTIITSVFVMIFLTVFFPTINQFEIKKPIFKKLNKLSLLLIPVLVVMLPIQIFVLIKYAYSYTIFVTLIGAFTLSTILIILSSVYGNLLISIDLKSVKYYAGIIFVTSLLNIGLNLVLIPQFFLTGAITATIITNLINAGAIFGVTKKLMK